MRCFFYTFTTSGPNLRGYRTFYLNLYEIIDNKPKLLIALAEQFVSEGQLLKMAFEECEKGLFNRTDEYTVSRLEGPNV